MFLGINQNLHNNKKRKLKEQEAKAKAAAMGMPKARAETEASQAIAALPSQAAMASTRPPRNRTTTNDSQTNLLDNILMEFSTSAPGTPTIPIVPSTGKKPTPTPQICKNCQHSLRSDHDYEPQHEQREEYKMRQQYLPSSRLPCDCDCMCVHKIYPQRKCSTASSASSTVSISLYTVYICLGTLALALATLYVLFFSHINSLPPEQIVPPQSSSTPSNFAFREHFRRELIASDHLLRSIVVQILQQNYHHAPINDGISASTLIPASTGRFTVSPSGPLDNSHYSSTSKLETSTKGVKGAAAATSHDDSEFVKNEGKLTNSIQYANNNNEDTTATTTTIIRNNNNNNIPNNIMNNVDSTIKRLRRDISSSPSSMHADPFIEFFNPTHRKALEEQDLEIRKRTGMKGAAPGGDEWVYINTYCRVPEKIITGFCKSTQEYCPPGPVGPPGIPGPKGNRGDIGIPGPPGADGAQGPLGPKGSKGDIGIPGRAGLDGRDGVPGEPGLDGVPGRAGADGIPGKDGSPGRDGRDGLNGKDGKDGMQGLKGAQGPPGERGLKGIAGPRGRPGKAGTNGTPGIPGINAWQVKLVNGSYSNDLLIPPSIADLNAPNIQRTIIVEEGKTLNLSCAATGNPTPHIEWRRDDGRTINVHGIEMSSVAGPYLKFTNITRNQMAAYTCFADNGIPPVANATFLVEVHFSPMIAVYRQMIYAEYGQTATMECLVEAFPEAIRYWERAYDGKILDPGDKYRIETYPDGFKTTMRLTISNLRKDDFGYYHCVARNELNATMVNFEIAPQDPNSAMPYVGKEIKVYGQRPPESECPVCEHCPDLSLYQCKDSINSNFEIQPTGNYSYPGLPKRQKSCLLYAVGKPVFHKAVNEIYGCWLKDAAAREIDREKTFVTNENDSYNLFEFTTKMQYRMNSVPRKKYEIREGFHGNAHIVYNGSFYYNQRNTDLVVKLDLTTLKKITTQLPYAGIAAGHKLYSTDYNYMDFNVDEVGLWVIYSTYDSNNTLVAKLDAETLKMQYNFNISLDHHQFGEMFIVCGHLYAIDSCTEKNSQIRYVVDLYNGKLLNVDLPFSNPFRKTTTVGYNPLTVELYSWDKGNALTYPIRYHEQALGVDRV